MLIFFIALLQLGVGVNGAVASAIGTVVAAAVAVTAAAIDFSAAPFPAASYCNFLKKFRPCRRGPKGVQQRLRPDLAGPLEEARRRPALPAAGDAAGGHQGGRHLRVRRRHIHGVQQLHRRAGHRRPPGMLDTPKGIIMKFA